MRIETANKIYHVIGYLGHDETKDFYLCEDSKDQKLYYVIGLGSQHLLAKTVEFLYEQVESPTFSDLAECFVFQERLHLAFHAYQGEVLKEKIQSGYCSIEERLEIEKQLLEKMVLQGMPCYFQRNCLQIDRIYVTKSLDISFQYSVDDLMKWNDVTMGDVQERLSRITEFLFQDELKKEVVDPMDTFIEFLQNGKCESYLEMYQRFQTVYQQILGISRKELESPKTWIFRLWDRVKKSFPFLKRAGVLILLVLGLIYLIWTIGEEMKPSEPVTVITQIGTERV